MTTWSLDYDEFAALCEQLLGSGNGSLQTGLQSAMPPSRRGYRGLWFHYAATCGLGAPRRFGLRRGFGFPRGRRA